MPFLGPLDAAQYRNSRGGKVFGGYERPSLLDSVTASRVWAASPAVLVIRLRFIRRSCVFRQD